MINLIPPSARAMVVKEYWLRVAAVWLFLFGTACLLVASLLLPTYMLLRTELIALRDQVAANAAETASIDEGAAALVIAMTDAKTLLAMATSSVVAQIGEIETLAGSAVTITSYQFETKESEKVVTITGVAANRIALANFRDALEEAAHFADATLPISSLIKDKNIDFTMTLNVTTP